MVTFGADGLTPTTLAMPARLRAREIAHLLAALYRRRFTALALPPVQLRSRGVAERLRWTEDGEEILALRSLLAYHARDLGGGEDGGASWPDRSRGEFRALAGPLARRGLLAQATQGPGEGSELVMVGTVGTPRAVGTYRPAAIIANAHFFTILPGDMDTHHVPLGEAAGLTARAGAVSRPPTASRTALVRTRSGWQVRRMGLDELVVTLPGGREVRRRSHSARLYMRGPDLPGGRTPVDPGVCEITFVGRWAVAVASGGGRKVPQGAIALSMRQRLDAHELEALRRGAPVHYRVTGLEDLEAGVQAGPRLVTGGQVCVDDDIFDEEEFYVSGSSEPVVPTVFPADANVTPAARLGVGVNSDGELLVAAVEGASALHGAARREGSGCTLLELAELLVELGAREAVNLDGGGSVQVMFGSGTLLRPADSRGIAGASFDRPVPSAVVFA
ncbi:MAG: phosphodiester glycosidase family protein [Trueperaceae bacterium]